MRGATSLCAARLPRAALPLCRYGHAARLTAALVWLAGQEMAEIRMDLMYPAVKQEGFKQLYARCGLPRGSLSARRIIQR